MACVASAVLSIQQDFWGVTCQQVSKNPPVVVCQTQTVHVDQTALVTVMQTTLQ